MKLRILAAWLLLAVPALAQAPDFVPPNRAIGATQIYPLGVLCTQRPAAIAAGGTAQVVAVANPTRKTLTLQNPSVTTAERITFTFAGAASATSLELASGGGYAWTAPFIPLGALSVWAATTGHQIAIEECQ